MKEEVSRMKKFLTSILVIMLVLVFSVILIITRSLSPYNQAKAETTELAGRKADLREVKDFYWFNGNETYFTITGSNSEGASIVVIVQQDGGEIKVLDEEDTISKERAIQLTVQREMPHKILEARIGQYNDTPVWEVSFELENDSIGYATFSLTSGKWVRTVKNI